MPVWLLTPEWMMERRKLRGTDGFLDEGVGKLTLLG